MARTNVPLTALVPNGGITEPAGTAVDPTNGHVIDVTSTDAHVIIEVNNTAVTDKVVTVKAGTNNPPAFRKDLGDVAVTVTASTRAFIGPLESARFIQPGQKLNIDMAAGITGTIAALAMPQDAV